MPETHSGRFNELAKTVKVLRTLKNRNGPGGTVMGKINPFSKW